MSQKNALIIGVSEYEVGDPLLHPAKDAKDIASALREMDFAVMLELNPSIKEFEDAIRNFSEAIKYNKEAAVFYYSGHGLQINGENYLVPRDAELDAEYRIKRQTIPLNEVLDMLHEARNLVNIVILDACRNNPFYKTTKSANKGLAGITNSPEGTILAYATSPGEVAYDGDNSNQNGVYTSELLKAMKTPGIAIESIFKKVRQNVKAVTKSKQIPWETSSLTSDFYFISPITQSESPSLDPKEAEEKYITLLEKVYKDNIVNEEERESLVEKRIELGIAPNRARELEATFKLKVSNLTAEKTNLEKQKLEEEQSKKELEKKLLLEVESKKEKAKQSLNQEVNGLPKQESKNKDDFIQTTSQNSNGNSKKIFMGIAIALVLSIGTYFAFTSFKGSTNIAKLENKKEIVTPEIFPKEFTDSNGIDFVLIPSGEFLMGCSGSIETDGKPKYTDNQCSDDEKPIHKVKISKPFYLGKYEVTQSQWKKIMGNNPSNYSKCGLDCPVEKITWRDTQRFTKKLNEQTNSNHYRLPTEAEWEFAARAGTNTKFFWGNETNIANEYRWSFLNTGNQNKTTHPVGKKKPNQFGLFDMIGNVSEWVQDSSSEDYYSKSPEVDPKGYDTGEMRFLRGGNINEEHPTSSYRFHASSVDAYYAWGFRLAMNVEGSTKSKTRIPELNSEELKEKENIKKLQIKRCIDLGYSSWDGQACKN